MPIVSSHHSVGPAQADGRRHVRESHTDNMGAVYEAEYLADPGTDYEAVLATRAASISDMLAEAEAMALTDDGV